MKVSLDELKAYGIYDSLPPKLRGLAEKEYYIFYYTLDEEQSKITIHKDDVVASLNVSLFRGLSAIRNEVKGNADVRIGYFSTPPFETRDGIFYLFLRGLCNPEVVSAFYARCAQSDKATDFTMNASASAAIFDRASFSKSLSYFANPNKLSSILSVYDMINDYVVSKLGYSLYGELIKKVVQIVYHEGGVMSEENGTLRFMIVGEKANLPKEIKERYEEARNMLRGSFGIDDVYIKTGWYFNTKDGKWKYNISDEEAKFKPDFLRDLPEYKLKLYKPPFFNVTDSELLTYFENPLKIFTKNYTGKLSDVIKHDMLFSLYPQLASLPLIFADKDISDDNYKFYFAEDYSGYMVIFGSSKRFDLLSTMLHETQHAVQNIENFATGGNQFLASFVVSIGGKEVRKVFSCINTFSRLFERATSAEEDYNRLKTIIESIIVSGELKMYKDNILQYFTSYKLFTEGKKNLAVNLIFFITTTKEYNEGELIDFLLEKIGDEFYELLEYIKDGCDNAEAVNEKLGSEGYKATDIRRIIFNAYEDLLGEVEARGTQAQMKIPANLSNYFYLDEWERSPARSIAVIGGDYLIADTDKIMAAVERHDDKYILHFKKTSACIPFIHEAGHIVHDLLILGGHEPAIKESYAKASTQDEYDEYFVNCFLGYLNESLHDENIHKELKLDMNIKSDVVINELLDEIFSLQQKVE